MFKQAIAILFFVGLLFQNLSRFVILADYSLNKTYIANVLCENKTIPSMHCNGKCYLSKKLQQDEKQQAPENQKTIPEIQLYLNNSTTELSSRTGILISTAYGGHHRSLASATLQNVFRPPVVLWSFLTSL